jgi:glycosyltransferase involved in cell wall biosynthesis
MRILHVTNAQKWSGGLKQVSILMRELIIRDHENILVCPPRCELPDRLEPKERARIQIERLPMFQDYDLFAAMKLKRLAGAHGAEIVHAHHSTAHAVALLALAGSRRPGLVVSRRVSFLPSGNPFSRWKYRSRRIGGFAAVSEAVKETLARGGVDRERIRVIYSAVDPAEFVVEEGVSRRIRREIGIENGAAVVGKIGNYGVAKGQLIFLEAAREVLRERPDTVFLLAGRQLESLDPVIAAMGLGESVRSLGFRTDVPALLSVMDVSVNAAIAGEGLSGAMRESLLMGVPVVASDVAGNREIVREGETGRLVPVGDPHAVARAILDTLAHAEEARRMAVRGREWVLAHAVPARMAEDTITLYRSVLGR